MRRAATLVCIVLVVMSCAWARKWQPAPEPNSFVIGRHTFLDFGPPNDFYELFIVDGTRTGTSVERITLTPAADACTLPAKVETASAFLKQPISELLGGMNPCAIPEKELHRELKRCKKCLVFSYVDVAMQVECGDQTRLIQSKILDRDMFDSRAGTPEDTSWTMRLLSRLDDAVGPGVMDRPMFSFGATDEPSARNLDSAVFQDLSLGKYDGLFPGAPDKASALLLAAEKPRPHPTIKLISVGPFTPEKIVLPLYPGIARLAHIQGTVSLSFYIGADNTATGLSYESGPPVLRGAVTEAVRRWKFDKKYAGSLQRVHAAIDFELNCPVGAK